MADTQTLHGLDDILAKLRALPPELASKRGGPVGKALRKGAVVIQKAAKANVRQVVANTVGAGYASTKTLERAIVIRRDSKPQMSGASERYQVRISSGAKAQYPSRQGQKEAVKAAQTGRWLEYGTEDQRAEPWMTPAFFSSRERALATVVDELIKGVDAAIAKVSKGGL